MANLRIALFVEGSLSPLPAHRRRPLEDIWNKLIAGALGVPRFDPIVPISKKHLVAMDPTKPRMSGAGERLDQLMVRVLRRQPFDAAVVAWDLVPAWNPEGQFCRRDETLDFYRLLADSPSLPTAWKRAARRRLDDLSARAPHRHRAHGPRLRRHTVLALCMEPMFEDLLVRDERAVRRALGVDESPPPTGWPNARQWRSTTHHPDADILAPAIRSLRRARPKPPIVRRVVGDFRTNKDGWGEYLLRQMLADERARRELLAHPLYRRVAEWLAPPRTG